MLNYSFTAEIKDSIISITTVIMSALILFVYYCNIPNPNMILIAGLVLCSERMDGLFRSVFQVLL